MYGPSSYDQLDGKSVERTYVNEAAGGLTSKGQGVSDEDYNLNRIYVESRVEVVWWFGFPKPPGRESTWRQGCWYQGVF